MPRHSKKASKDPNAPKRPLSGYFLFARDERLKIKSTQPNIPMTETMKLIGERWSKLDVNLKSHYTKLGAEEKLRYDQEMVVYRQKTVIVDSTESIEK
ncbi:unnamed protein product [Rotaria socialis]|uniref:HMG box domain-containing protein n=1 Tax=Rotaria socialis TaxID=392032 RepID=A0A818C1S0_9BILA|nr:unnamed protein product [Rotaria socialis]CAF4292746.1 unnamed protein product [Rotaria socialis]